MIEDFGVFIGMTSVPNYNSLINEPTLIKDQLINNTFREFRADLQKRFKNQQKLNKQLYEPINFYAFGSYSLITLSYIDDFHFGNFIFRPYNKYSKKNETTPNFQYQVTNNFRLVSKTKSLSSLRQERFVAITKIKINSSLLIGNDIKIIDTIKNRILKECNDLNFVMVGDSFSWHELTLITGHDSVERIMNVLRQLRGLCLSNIMNSNLVSDVLHDSTLIQSLKGYNPEKVNLFADTETSFGLSTKFFKNNAFFKKYEGSNLDSNVIVSSKIHAKTGHDNIVKSMLLDHFNDLTESIKFVNGRSDFSYRYVKHSTKNYIRFWRKLKENHGQLLKAFNSHVRKIHSNLSLSETQLVPNHQHNNDDLNDTINCNLSHQIFELVEIRKEKIFDLEQKLQMLRVPKEVVSKVVALYYNFNEAIYDVNLYCYYLDLKPLLMDLADSIDQKWEDFKNNQIILANKKVYDFTKILLHHVEIFEKGFQNRFLDSKKYGYNVDSKGDFNGGVHQLIHGYDSAYKLVTSAILGESAGLPIASYGIYEIGIKSNRLNLNLNYFQLFQPEFFLFSVFKENLNFTFDKAYFPLIVGSTNGNTEITDQIKTIQYSLSRGIHEAPKNKEILFQYLPPEHIEKKIIYVLNYFLFAKVVWSKDIDSFLFWYTHTYIQSANLHNCDGTIRIEVLKEHYFAIYIVNKALYGLDDCKWKQAFEQNVKLEHILYLLFGSKNSSIHEEVKILIDEHENLIEPIIILINEIYNNLFNESKNEIQFYNDLLVLIQEQLYAIKNEILNSGGNTYYVRNTETGIGQSPKDTSTISCDTLFDSLGGMFTICPKARISILKRRIGIIHELKRISYIYKRQLILHQ